MLNCSKCGYVTNRNTNLTRHMKLKHDVEKQMFSCTSCDQKFTTAHSMRRHLSCYCKNMQFSDCVEHAENVTHLTANVAFRPANVALGPANVALGPANVATDPRHECHQCGKNFKRNCNLTKHMKSCKGVHSLQCHICLKAF